MPSVSSGLLGDAIMSAPKPSKQRNRASVACAACRIRRTKCVVGPETQKCDQCLRSGLECMIRNDDGRKREISKAYMNSLTERIELLESMLQQTGQKPPVNHPPYTDLPVPGQAESLSVLNPGNIPKYDPSGYHNGSMPGRSNDSGDDKSSDNSSVIRTNSISVQRAPISEQSSLSPSLPDVSNGIVSKLLSTSGHLGFDHISGRLRYFGPTTNFHIYSDLSLATSLSEARETNRRTERVIRELSSATHDYLMDLFWTFYNCIIHTVHKEAFYEDKASDGTASYSGFLHICILAMGFRYADKNREDIRKISLSRRECILHKEAKHMFEHELEKPGGVPSVQALLILGDLEFGCGRDNMGWMLSGMACRLAFDVGLNLDCGDQYFSEREIQVRHMVSWACIMYDNYLALVLGRSTSIKTFEIAISKLPNQFLWLGTCRPSGPDENLETLIYEALLRLIDLVAKITETIDTRFSPADHNAYLRMTVLDREINAWYNTLPQPLKWTPNNVLSAPFSFFHLHQQYHTALILLHRPFALYKSVESVATEGDVQPDSLSHFSLLSRTVCFENAIWLARIFKNHRQRFETRQTFITGLQHAGTAATVLISGIALIKDPKERIEPLRHLGCLAQALTDMSPMYSQAEHMSNVLKHVLSESGWNLDNVPELDNIFRPSITARRPNPDHILVLENSAKKRQHVVPQHIAENPFSFDSRTRSENFSSINQRSGLGLASIEPSPSKLCDTEGMVWTNINPSYDPIFFSNERDILGLVGAEKPEVQGETLDDFNGLDLSSASEELFGHNVSGPRLSDIAGGSPDLWGDVLRQLGAPP